MAGEPVILALDIGTSGARAVLFDAGGRELAHRRATYATAYPQPGWSEQQPEQAAEAVVAALRDGVAAIPSGHRLAGVAFSTQMYSILALDHDGAPLTGSLTWGDVRSAEVAAELRGRFGALPRRTGCPIQAIYPLAKIRWLKRRLALPAGVRFVAIKDFVLLRLTGELVTDWSTASASGLLDITRRDWDAEALAACEITPAQLPRLVSPRHILTGWRDEITRATGIPAGTPLIMGAGDAPLANIGVGATAGGALALNIGTSAAARALIDQPQTDPAGRLWTYIADVDRWTVGGIIGSGGAVYEWLIRDVLARPPLDSRPESLFAAADALAESVPPGADGLLFIPYLSGEQSPGWNAGATGLIHGLTLRHGAGHVVRAAIEGIAFALWRAALPIAELRRQRTERVYMTGGLSTSRLWRQIVADVFGAPVVAPHSPESSARGAAVLGWMALGAADSYAHFAQPESLLDPDPARQALYRERFEAFCRLNARLQPESSEESEK
ncbi:MAG: gluconokinase [Anaerolineae bacterium]|nr:gluconokinase [Anaerolineae bacterium]